MPGGMQGVDVHTLSMAQLDALERLHHAALSRTASRRLDLVLPCSPPPPPPNTHTPPPPHTHTSLVSLTTLTLTARCLYSI